MDSDAGIAKGRKARAFFFAIPCVLGVLAVKVGTGIFQSTTKSVLTPGKQFTAGPAPWRIPTALHQIAF